MRWIDGSLGQQTPGTARATSGRPARTGDLRARVTRALLVLTCALLGTLNPTACDASPAEDVAAILRAWTDAYRSEAPDSLSLIVELRIRTAETGAAPADSGELIWHVTITPAREVALREGANPQAAFVFSMSAATLRKIDQGRLSAATAVAKGVASGQPPLVFRPTAEARLIPDMRDVMMEFLQRFFNPSCPERILLGQDYSRLLQGAHAIPLYYAVGMRSAWYRLEPGQRLNERGGTHTYRQAYILLSGQGRLQIAGETTAVQAGQSYYIPPNATYGLHNDSNQPLELIWLAWGEGA